MRTTLSVIVPVYNAEKYIQDCVQSILDQKYENLDVVLVDDGSTDDSYKICQSIALKDGRVRVIRIDNSGPYQARRAGVAVSKGEIVTFVDADDTIEMCAYDELMKIYDEYKPDMIAFNYVYNGKTTTHSYYRDGLYSKEEIRKKVIPGMMHDAEAGERKMEPPVCTKIMKKELFMSVTDQIESRITLGDDALVTYPAICVADNLYITNKSYYHYNENLDSCTHNYPLERITEVQNFQYEITKFYEEIGFKDIMKYQVECYVRSFITMMIKKWYGLNLSSITHFFPYSAVRQGSKVAIYGAGNVGKSYINELKVNRYADIECWVDQGCDITMYNGYEVLKPAELLNKQFDVVIIAIFNDETALQIKNNLISMGIKEEKIVWKKPVCIG